MWIRTSVSRILYAPVTFSWDLYIDCVKVKILAPPFFHLNENFTKVSENGHFSLVMDIDCAQSRPYPPVYNRRWDHSIWYLPTKNLPTVLNHLVIVCSTISICLPKRLQLVTRLEAVSLALSQCSSLFDSTLASGSSVNTLQFDVALVPSNWMDRRLSVWSTPRVSLTFNTYSQERVFGAISFH